MSDESKEQLSSADTSKEEVDAESRDTSMEQEDTGASKGDKSDDKSEEESEDKKDEEEEEEEDSDDEPQVGLLEKPLILEEGKKRERKKVERISFQAEEKSHEGLEIKEGKGRSLGDIPFIEFKLGRTKAEDVKPLHRLLYRRQGTVHEVKKNVRQFSGFPFSKDDTEYEKRVQLLKGKSYPMPLIKKIMEILDIPRSGSKDELITRLMEWLEKPSDSGRKLPQPKRKRKSKGGKGKKDKKKEKKKRKEKKTKETADDDDDDEEEEDIEEKDEPEEDEDDEDDKAESDVSDVSEEEEEEPPKKKVKKSTPKPAKEKKTKEKATPKPKTPKATNKKKATPKKKAKVVSEEVSDVSSDSDDEPLVAKKTKGPPTNDELKDVIKKMLDTANLEQVTMKTVLKDVFAKYPDFDLSDRKDFIKNTVKQIIS